MAKYCLLGATEYVALKVIYKYVIEPNNELWVSELERLLIIERFNLKNTNDWVTQYFIKQHMTHATKPLYSVVDTLEAMGVVERKHEGRLVYIKPKQRVDWISLLTGYLEFVYAESVRENGKVQERERQAPRD